MQTFFIEVTHVDAAHDLSVDFMTEWQNIDATTEAEAFDKVTAAMLVQNRAVTAQTVWGIATYTDKE